MIIIGFVIAFVLYLVTILWFIRWEKSEYPQKSLKQVAIPRIYFLLIIFVLQFVLQTGINYFIFQKPENEKEEQFRNEVNQKFGMLIEKEFDMDELTKILSETRQDIFKLSTEEAKDWAERFIPTLPEQEEKSQFLEEKRKELSGKEIPKLKLLFDFILNSFDARVHELREQGEDLRVEHVDFELTRDEASDIPEYWIRSVQELRTHENSIEVRLIPAVLSNEILRNYPTVEFNIKHQGKLLHIFTITKKPTGPYILLQGPDYRLDPIYYHSLELSQFNKEALNSHLNKLFEDLYLLKP